MLCGCSGGGDSSTPPPGGPKVTIRGSNTVGEELAPKLIAAYKQDHPGVAFDLESKGTGYGFGNLLAGGCDIAAASREASATDVAMAADRGIQMSNIVIGSYCVAVVVNAGNAVTDLTRAQVRYIFTGAIKNWKDVGGADAPIDLFIRDPISGTYLGFRELAMENKDYEFKARTATNYAGIADAVAQDANAIGYVSFDLLAKSGLKSLKIGGVAPAADIVNKRGYPYARRLHLYVNPARESSEARDFIAFIMSPAGQKTLTAAGYVSP